MAESPLTVVSIMNYPPEQRFLRMCYIFLDSIIAHGAKRIRLIYREHKPIVTTRHHGQANIEIHQGQWFDAGYPHFNLCFKLPNLASLDFPFLYLDVDMVILKDLNYLWQRRRDKPWVGINHQWVPFDDRTHLPPFLNSGLQLVGDPSFYRLEPILAAQNAVRPLSSHSRIANEDLEMFACPGVDQAVLFRYFKTIGYDYTHPEIGPEWNSCSAVTKVWAEGDGWKARTNCLTADYDVHNVHYWSQYKPWAINCPIYNSYAWVDEELRQLVA